MEDQIEAGRTGLGGAEFTCCCLLLVVFGGKMGKETYSVGSDENIK